MSDDIKDTKDINYQRAPKSSGKAVAGMILLLIGCVLLFRQLDYFFIPDWIWSWPTWVLLWGIWAGARHNFQKPIWFILIFIGLFGMLNEAIPGLHLGNFMGPVIIIMIGIWIIMRRNQSSTHREKYAREWEKKWDWRYHTSVDQPTPTDPNAPNIPPVPPVGGRFTTDDFIDCTSIFGGAKKTILSKNFRGGDVTAVFGGAEIDLTQADINGRVVIDITQVFGGTKIIVPPHWQVISNLSAVFAGVDDKRMRVTGSGDNNKILVLEGVSIFAGIEIRTF